MAEQEHGETVRLSEVIGRTARRWRLILSIALIGAVLGAAYSFIQQDEYTATAALTVSPITTNPFNSGAVNQQINITTERAILSSPEVARIAADSLGRDVSPSELLAGSEVAAPSGSQVLEVTVTTGSPSDAADFANALAAAYLDFRAEGAADVALGFIDALDRRILALEGQETLDAADRAELSSLQEQKSSLSLVAENPGRIIGEATAPGSPSSPGLVVWMLVGGALGLLLGSTLAFLKDRLDPFVRSAARLRERAGARVVAFRGDRDKDAARRIVRLILQRSAALDDPAPGPLRLIVLDTRGASSQPLLDNLSEAFAGAARTIRVMTAEEHVLVSSPAAHDAGAADQQPSIVLIQASSADQDSWKEAHEDDAGLLIVTHKTTRMAEISRVTADVRSVPGSSPMFVFIDEPVDGTSRPRTRQRGRMSTSTISEERA